MIISILNPKGGAGKTTIATNLATALCARAETLLVDTDPLCAAERWREASEIERPLELIGVKYPKPLLGIQRTARKYGYTVIDGTATAENMLATSIKISDVVIVPVQPSYFDVWGTRPAVEVIKTRQTVAEYPHAFMLLNGAKKNTILTADVQDELEEVGLPVFNTVIHRRQAYANMVKTGGTVFDTYDYDAIEEINSLATELLERV